MFLFIFLTANEEENCYFAQLLLVAQVPISLKLQLIWLELLGEAVGNFSGLT